MYGPDRLVTELTGCMAAGQRECAADPRGGLQGAWLAAGDPFGRSSPCLAATFGPADQRLFAPCALLGFVFVKHRSCRSLPLGAELVAVFAAPFIGGDARRIGLAEMRHHVTLVKLIGALGFRPVGPVMGLLQKHTKSALLVVEPAIAMNSSGELIVSNPAEWCSPIQAS